MVERIDHRRYAYSFEQIFRRHEKLYKDHIGTLFGTLLGSSPMVEPFREDHQIELHLPQVKGSRMPHSMGRYLHDERFNRVVMEPLPSFDPALEPLRLKLREKALHFEFVALTLRSLKSRRILWQVKGSEAIRNAVQLTGAGVRVPDPRAFRVLALGEETYLELPRLSVDPSAAPYSLEVWVAPRRDLGFASGLWRSLVEENEAGHQALNKLRRLESSFSWKLTAPFRYLRRKWEKRSPDFRRFMDEESGK